jgi:hypothetical protein
MSGIDKFFLQVIEFVTSIIYGVIEGVLGKAFPGVNWGGCLGVIFIFGLTMICCTIITMFF